MTNTAILCRFLQRLVAVTALITACFLLATSAEAGQAHIAATMGSYNVSLTRHIDSSVPVFGLDAGYRFDNGVELDAGAGFGKGESIHGDLTQVELSMYRWMPLSGHLSLGPALRLGSVQVRPDWGDAIKAKYALSGAGVRLQPVNWLMLSAEALIGRDWSTQVPGYSFSTPGVTYQLRGSVSFDLSGRDQIGLGIRYQSLPFGHTGARVEPVPGGLHLDSFVIASSYRHGF